jgi:hypothetical protein
MVAAEAMHAFNMQEGPSSEPNGGAQEEQRPQQPAASAGAEAGAEEASAPSGSGAAGEQGEAEASLPSSPGGRPRKPRRGADAAMAEALFKALDEGGVEARRRGAGGQ